MPRGVRDLDRGEPLVGCHLRESVPRAGERNAAPRGTRRQPALVPFRPTDSTLHSWVGEGFPWQQDLREFIYEASDCPGPQDECPLSFQEVCVCVGRGGLCRCRVTFFVSENQVRGTQGSCQSLAEIHSSYLGRSLKVCVKKVTGRWLSSSSLQQQKRPSL